MIFKVPHKVLKHLSKIENEEGDKVYPYIDQLTTRWKDDDEQTEIDTKKLNDTDFNAIKEFILKDTEETNEKIIKIYGFYKSKLKVYEKLLSDGANVRIKALNQVEVAFYEFTKQFPNHRFYKEDEYGNILPWRAMSAQWYPREKETPEHVTLSFSAFKRGTIVRSTFSVWLNDIRGLTLGEILEGANYLAENDEMNQIYEEQIEKFEQSKKTIGKVFEGSGVCTKKQDNSWYSSYGIRYFFKSDGLTSNKVVADHDGWNQENDKKDGKDNPSANSNITKDYVLLPEHPFTTVFHLDDHVWLDTHISKIEPYKFDTEILSQLILPQTHLMLIQILMKTSKLDIEDIIKGKKGGSFIMSTGEPGTGKTLTAEVFSEVMQLALYKVQCSQLGLSVDNVEKNLKHVLFRASRWGAILLIDEADVYVRARGNDIMQNAIVGVFLRTLEYYTGILFMTSNMGTQIDDAIMSRATAHLIYEIPTPENLKKIWTVQNLKFKTELEESSIDQLLIEVPGIVGRDVKALLKLAKIYSTIESQKVTVDLIKDVSKFVPNVAKKMQILDRAQFITS